MGNGIWFSLIFLLVLLCLHGSLAREIAKGNPTNIQTTYHHHPPIDDDDGKRFHHVHTHTSSSSSSHMMDDGMGLYKHVFFTTTDLKAGKILPLYIPRKNPSSSPRILPREEADTIPFTSSRLPLLFELFSFSRDSSQAKAMAYTLNHCELPPIKGEKKFCATSLESMLDYVNKITKSGPNLKVITTTHLIKSNDYYNLLRNYTIMNDPYEISADKMIACHPMPYPYALFYCHGQESGNRVFLISLGDENGRLKLIDGVAVCHMDTSHWDPGHVSFRMLGVEPGKSPVCHFSSPDSLVWVPLSTSAV